MTRTLRTKIFTMVVLITVLATTCIGSVHSATLDEIQKQIDSAQGQKGSISDKLNNLTNMKKQTTNQINARKAELSEVEKAKQINFTEKELLKKDIEHMYEMILNMNDTINNTQNEYDQKSDLFKERVKVMYQYSEYTPFQILLESNNLLDFINRAYQLATLLKKDRDLMDELDWLKRDLEHKKTLQSIACEDTELVLAEKEKILSQLEQKQNIVESDYLSSRKALDSLIAEEDQLLIKSKEIENTIKKLQEESNKIKYEGGNMIWPAGSGTYISSPFGNRLHPIEKVWRMHTGIDIPAPGGSNILAANGGKVIVAAWDNGYGNYIIIDHGGGITTVYAHSSKLVSKVGDNVSKGQVIAKIGTTGSSTGNHLHFEVRVNGAPVNPLNYVKIPS